MSPTEYGQRLACSLLGVSVFAAVLVVGCLRTDSRKVAIDTVLAKLNQEVRSNLTSEAAQWIQESQTRPHGTNEYWGDRTSIPAASRLAGEYGNIWIDLTGDGSPCMVIQIPFLQSRHPYLVYVLVKPGGKYSWNDEYIKCSDEIVLKAIAR